MLPAQMLPGHFNSCLLLKSSQENYILSLVNIEWVTVEIFDIAGIEFMGVLGGGVKSYFKPNLGYVRLCCVEVLTSEFEQLNKININYINLIKSSKLDPR